MARRNRFVKPKAIRLEISDGDWVEIKKELTVGERKRMFASGLKQMQASGTGDPKFDIDPVEMSFAKVKEYLTGWSFEEEDDNGEVTAIELTEDAIRSLDEATFEEIEKVIDEHTDRLEKEKKAAAGRIKQEQTSP